MQSRIDSERLLSKIEKCWMLGNVRIDELPFPSVIDAGEIKKALARHVRLNVPAPRALGLGELAGASISQKRMKGFDPSVLKTINVNPTTSSTGTADKILSILLNRAFRRGELEIIEPYIDVFREKISEKVVLGEPIELVLPALPFKCQNPFSTGHSIGFVDLGEWLLFAQMRNMIASVEAIYEPGLRVFLIADGLVYSDIFTHGDTIGVEAYFSRCHEIKEVLGLGERVELIDMSWVTEATPSFRNVRTEIENSVKKLSSENEDVMRLMNVLREGMLYNIPAPGLGINDMVHVLKIREKMPSWLFAFAEEAALRYSSFLIAMSHLRVLERAFPGAIRATSHLKRCAQLPLNLVNRRSFISPHNGVPLIASVDSAAGHFISRTKITRLVDVLSLASTRKVSAVFSGESDEPFFYELDKG